MCMARVRSAAASLTGSAAASATSRTARGARSLAASSMPADMSAPSTGPAAGEFGEVAAVAAADVGDGVVAVEPGEPERLAGQVYPRLLVGVDGLPRGQVDVRLVLGFPQVGLVRPRVPGRIGTGHPVLSGLIRQRSRTTTARC